MASRPTPVRVLQINSGNRDFGGVSSFLYNVYTHIDRDRVQFDFLSPYKSTYGIHRDQIEAMGGRVYELGISGNKLDRKRKLYPGVRGFLRRHPYAIVHVNSGNFFFDLAVTRAVKDAGVKNIIVHSHSIENPKALALKKKVVRMLKPMLESQLTARCACSTNAARFMFLDRIVDSNGVTIVRNGLEIHKFEYDEGVRREMRRALGVSDRHVLGHVGRFFHGKNQAYLVRVFARLAQRDPEAVLVMVGDGEELERVKAQVKDLGLDDRVRFTGTQSDIQRYYQAFDAFAFPSVWEGLGMALVEAQIAGLHCVASTGVPAEADVTGNVVFLDMGDENIDRWAEAVEGAFSGRRRSCAEQALAAGYDIDAVAEGLATMYLNMSNQA